jgi:hypothetical protein
MMDEDASTALERLENAKHDCANKGEGDVSGHYAQLTDEWTKGHWIPPRVGRVTARHNVQTNHRFHDKKVSSAVHPRHLGGAQSMATWLKSRENKTLMSP